MKLILRELMGLSSDFRADNPYRIPLYKTRIVAVGLGCLCLALGCGLAFTLLKLQEQSVLASNLKPAADAVQCLGAPPAVETVQVLVARESLETNSNISKLLLESRSVPKAMVPQGVALAADLESIAGMYNSEPIPAETFIPRRILSKVREPSPMHIPAGYRAISLELDRRNAADGLLRQNGLVDVIWVFKNDKGSDSVRTLIHGAQILSLNVPPGAQGSSGAATLLVLEQDVRVLELARETGRISLALVSEDEYESRPVTDDSMTFVQLLSGKTETEEQAGSGILMIKDSLTGTRIQYVLKNKSWEQLGQNVSWVDAKVKADALSPQMITPASLSRVRAKFSLQ